MPNTFFTNLLTGKDNTTYDIARVLWALGSLVYLFLSIVALFQGQSWHPMEFGTGLSAIFAGGGISIGVKSHTEPEPKEN